MKYSKGRGESHGDKSQNGGDVPPSIRVDIIEHPDGGGLDTGGGGWVPTPAPGSGGGSSDRSDPPEKQLTLFALRLALLEKAASGLGKLDFVWATVVLLGGFVSILTVTDFWCITFILVGEGARVFSRSHELEWQHHSTETSTAGSAVRHGSRIFSRIWHAIVDHSHHHHHTAAAGGGRDAPAAFSPSNQEPAESPRQHAMQTPGGGRDAPAVFSPSSYEQPNQSHQHQNAAMLQTPKATGRLFRRIVHALTITDPAAAAAVGADGVSGDASTSTKAAEFHAQIAALRKKRTGHAPNVSLLPYTGQVFASRSVGRLLNVLQILSALTCVALSLMRLWKHDFNDGDESTRDSSYRNKRPALLLFYTLALLEALLFLLEQAYWTWKFSGLIQQVSKDCVLDPYGHVSLKRFFYDAYSRCIDGSILDGIKMDLVTFAEELILSDFQDEQLIGVVILERFATNKSSQQGDTLRKVGTSPRSVERLVEMLNWKRPDEKEVRLSAAHVVSKLAGKSQNALRLSGIPGAIESVMSLLYNTAQTQSAPVSSSGKHDCYDYPAFNLLGLRILKKLAKDPDNCAKMSSARGLLARIIGFTKASEDLLRSQHAPDSQLDTVKRALQVVKMLVTTEGKTGKALREGVAENVFLVSNLRDILRYGGTGKVQKELQKLAIDVLTGLALEHKGEESIMATGGLVKLLLSIFIGGGAEDKELGPKAGGALAKLALKNKKGCAAILNQLRRDDVLLQLLSLLQQDRDEARRLQAARLLRNLSAYSGPEHRERLRVVTELALPAVLTVTMMGKDTILEVCVGLTTQICSFIDGKRFADVLRGAGVEERAYVQRLADILREYKCPQVNVPRMRRFVVQQVIWLMTTSGGGRYTVLLKEAGMEGLLESVADTMSELECYHVFSGGVGIGSHRESMGAIVCSALELITGGGSGGGAPAQGPPVKG